MSTEKASLFDTITNDLREKGYSIQVDALNIQMMTALHQEISSKPMGELKPAGIGRDKKHTLNNQIRRDHIEWIDESTPVGRQWLDWVDNLKQHINRRLYLGLELFESHYAHYTSGAFYQRHKDAFVGESNRILSLVAYLNPNWHEDDEGEFVLYENENDVKGLKVSPKFGTLVLFLSEEFPHEVLPAKQDRYSIAGWFRQKSAINL